VTSANQLYNHMCLEMCVFGLQEIQQVKTPEELENFMLKHGENIIDTLGAEVDRLEKELKVSDETIVQNLCISIPTLFQKW